MIALPLAILWFGALLMSVIDGTRKPVGWLAVAIMAAATIATVVLGVEVSQEGQQTMAVGGWSHGIGITLRVDMMGIVFEGNRDLRRIYMSPDYRSFPQRKDFVLPDDAADTAAQEIAQFFSGNEIVG